jgi:hypothetical protein
MYPETRHKTIIALSFLIAVAWGSFQPHAKPVEAGVVAFICTFPLLYAFYYGLHVLGWVFFSGEAGNGLRIIPRFGAALSWIVRTITHAIATALLWIGAGTSFIVRAGRNAYDRHQWEKARPERERREAERREAERRQAEEEARRRKAEEDEAHRLRVAREAELTAARVKAEQAAILEAQAEVNRMDREHKEFVLAMEKERTALAEQRVKRHGALMDSLADLVEKSKG